MPDDSQGSGGGRLRGATVLLTGGTGFLGGRIAEILALHAGARVRALVRNYGSAGMPRLARLPVELVVGDLRRPEAVLAAAAGCQYVVHCGFGTSGNRRVARQVTVEGTRHVLEAAARQGARGVVHVSTAIVHGTPHGRTVRESDPYHYSGRPYADSKIAADKLALDYHRTRGVPVAVVRPGRIFGPWGEQFTVRIVNDIKAGRATLVDSGRARAGVVYVDTVADAILCCLVSPAAAGAAFIAGAEEQITWRELYAAYADMLSGAPGIDDVTVESIERQARWRPVELVAASAGAAAGVLTSALSRLHTDVPLVRMAVQKASALVPERLKYLLERSGELASRATGTARARSTTTVGPRPPAPEPWRARALAADTWFASDKIREQLGFKERIGVRDGLELTRQWLAWARLI